MNLLYEKETYQIRKAIFDVYNKMRSGFLEAVYHECLEREFTKHSIPYSSEKTLKILYEGEPLKQTYRADFICHDKIIIEIKAVKTLKDEHTSQQYHYLRTTNMKLGLLVNFGNSTNVEIKRIISTENN